MGQRRGVGAVVRAWLGVLALGGGALGCGSDAPTEAERVARAAGAAATAASLKELCERRASPRFVREVYGNLNTCLELNKLGQGLDPDKVKSAKSPLKASVSATRINGDKATTLVTITQSPVGVIRGRVALVKIGGAWKLDRYGLDFLRSMLRLDATPVRADERQALCLRRAGRTLPSGAFRELMNEAISLRLEGSDLPDAFDACLGGADQQAPVRRAPASVVARLPIDANLGNLCAHTETPDALRRRITRSAEYLIQQLRRRPDDLLAYTYSYEGADDERRDITIRQLARDQLEYLKSGGRRCQPALQRRIRAAAK